jgi:hypothetical protein
MSIDNTDAVHADTGVQAEDADQAQAPEAATEAAWPTAPAYVFSAPRRVATYDAAGPSSRMGAGTRSRSFFRSARW